MSPPAVWPQRFIGTERILFLGHIQTTQAAIDDSEQMLHSALSFVPLDRLHLFYTHRTRHGLIPRMTKWLFFYSCKSSLVICSPETVATASARHPTDPWWCGICVAFFQHHGQRRRCMSLVRELIKRCAFLMGNILWYIITNHIL